MNLGIGDLPNSVKGDSQRFSGGEGGWLDINRKVEITVIWDDFVNYPFPLGGLGQC